MTGNIKIVSPVVIATENRGKLAEYRYLLEKIGISAISRHAADVDAGLTIEESALTFEGNARIKAETLYRLSGYWALGDDSGLEVDALAGRPGVRSSRYAGDGLQGAARDQANNRKLLEELDGVEENLRTARFRCVIVLAGPQDGNICAEGVCEGKIAFSPAGEHGFGYDPVFIPRGFDRTMAELTMEQKNQISHRGKALEQLVKKMLELF